MLKPKYVRSAGVEASDRIQATADVNGDKLSELIDKMTAMQSAVNSQKQEITRLSKALSISGNGASTITVEPSPVNTKTESIDSGKGNYRNSRHHALVTLSVSITMGKDICLGTAVRKPRGRSNETIQR